MMDFFSITSKYINSLNANEKEIYNFIVRNMEEVKNYTIRELASKCFVSPATIIRFLRKIGFKGYSDFITVLRYTDLDSDNNYNPFVVSQDEYKIEYLKNIYESVRVLEKEKVDKIIKLLQIKPRIIVMARGLDKSVGHYFEYIFSGLGFEVLFPEDYYFRKMTLNGVKDNDLVFFFSFEGEDEQLIQDIEELNARSKAIIISITSADNNSIQNMSHINLYVFADFVQFKEIHLTSRVSMIAIIDILAYQYIDWILPKGS